MLLAGLKREATDEIVLDLLTQFDLGQMKKRKQSNEESIDTPYDPK